jgi:DNA-binding GntR family transcriptional regulator
MLDNGVARQDVFSAILELITSHQLKPGDRLTEAVLAADLQVSRTPVREALRELSARGYVDLEKNRGAVVAIYNDDLEELFQLRGLLEGFAAGLVAERMTDEQIQELIGIQERYVEVVESQQPEAWRVAAQINLEFHKLICSAAQNSRLEHFINMVTSEGLARSTYSRYTLLDMRRSVSQHDQLIDAIQRRDRRLAEMVMRVHIGAAEYRMRPEAAPDKKVKNR